MYLLYLKWNEEATRAVRKGRVLSFVDRWRELNVGY